jgi:hypothetical protein
MSTSSYSGSGLSAKEFKLYATEAGQWLWGTVRGAFNEKQTISQIIVDAVIGMIPLVGDLTAVRDLIAVGTGLADHPEKRENKMEWVLLVVLIFALIPVIGGVIKGVGRLALKVTQEAATNSKVIARTAEEIIAFLNRIGHKNAEAWFKALNVLKYEAELLAKFRAFCDTVILSITRYVLRFKGLLPQSVLARADQLANSFRLLKESGEKMIPDALKELHKKLQELQKYVHAGGVPPPSKAKTLLAQTGQKTVTYVEEARLLESGAKNVVHAGKYEQNVAGVKNADRIRSVYTHESPYPDLMKRKDDTNTYYPAIAAASGPIKNEMLSGETLFRSFGPEGHTLGHKVGESHAVGAFWGRGAPLKIGKEWREKCAVLDEWNRNGWVAMVHIPPKVKIPACTSTVSEQFSKTIPGQYLPGGERQAFVDAFFESQVMALANQLYKKGGGKDTVKLKNGSTIEVEVKQSGWSGINGKVGYGQTVIPGAAMTQRLGITERQTKVTTKASEATAKHERNEAEHI